MSTGQTSPRWGLGSIAIAVVCDVSLKPLALSSRRPWQLSHSRQSMLKCTVICAPSNHRRQWPWRLPSLASQFEGVYVAQLGRGFSWPPAAVLLAELCSAGRLSECKCEFQARPTN